MAEEGFAIGRGKARCMDGWTGKGLDGRTDGLCIRYDGIVVVMLDIPTKVLTLCICNYLLSQTIFPL